MPSNPVRLEYATTQAFSVSGMSYAYTYVKANVENLAFAKDVEIHYRTRDGSWHDAPLHWKANFGDFDVFGAEEIPYTEEFAIRYSVDGSTYWDNNGFANYRVATFRNAVGGNVMLNSAQAHTGTEAGGGFVFTTSWMEGEIYLNNLSYNKKVGVRFSADGGMNWEDCDATYSGQISEGTYSTSLGAELWKFRTPSYNYDDASPQFRFAVYYNDLDTGNWHWDNDFGNDYHLDKHDGSRIE